MKKRSIIILAFVLALCMSTSVFATNLNDAKKDLETISGEIDESKQELNQAKTKNIVRDQLNQIERNYKRKSRIINSENQLNRTQMELDTVKGELQEAEEEPLNPERAGILKRTAATSN